MPSYWYETGGCRSQKRPHVAARKHCLCISFTLWRVESRALCFRVPNTRVSSALTKASVNAARGCQQDLLLFRNREVLPASENLSWQNLQQKVFSGKQQLWFPELAGRRGCCAWRWLQFVCHRAVPGDTESWLDSLAVLQVPAWQGKDQGASVPGPVCGTRGGSGCRAWDSPGPCGTRTVQSDTVLPHVLPLHPLKHPPPIPQQHHRAQLCCSESLPCHLETNVTVPVEPYAEGQRAANRGAVLWVLSVPHGCQTGNPCPEPDDASCFGSKG